MSIFKRSKARKVVAVFVGLTMALGLVAGGASPAYAQTVEELQAQIESLLATIAALQAQLTALQTGSSVSSSGVCPYTWTRNLTVGSTGTDVMKLQQFLNSDSATLLASSGAGSPGNETEYFGPITKSAVIKFQEKYAADVLTPVGLSAGTGYVGPSTRAKLNSLCVSTPPPPPPAAACSDGVDNDNDGLTDYPNDPECTSATDTSEDGDVVITPAGTGLTVSKSADQPANMLAPKNAARVPFTKIDLTAGTDGDVTVDSVVVERTGQGSDDAFAGIVLMNTDGTLIGIAKTLNSAHQATVGTSFTIPAGTTKTVVIGANMNSSLSSQTGETPALSVVAVNTSATVTGVLPITGATHTINNSLSIGSVTTARGSLDPGSSQTKEVGTTGYNFSSVKFTAGSQEDLYLKSIRWYQSASAAASDLANVKTVVDGVEYDTTQSGKYYTTVFPDDGLLIKKGFSKDVTIKGDIVGGSNRGIDFDIDRRTDIHLVGKTYKYGITPPLASSAATADSSSFNNSDNPYYDAAEVTISAGTMNVSSWTGVPAQNLAVNLADQPIAGFTIDVKGEPISVGTMTFNFTLVDNSGSSIGLGDITNLKLVDENGEVLAGPADGSGATTKSGTIQLSDTVVFPVGVTNVILQAKLGTDFASNDTIAASTTPSSDFGTVTGQVTGNTITPAPTSAVSGPTQTVKAGSLTVTVSSQPTSRTVIAGAQQFEFARYIFDASASGEDVRITTIPLYFDTTGSRTDLTNCQLYDGIDSGSQSLTTGSNVKNPASGDTASSTTFTFDGAGLIIPKGTSKTLSLRCDLATNTSGSKYWWGLDSAQATNFTGASGITSGQTVAETLNDASGQQMTAAASGSYTVTNDSSVLYRAVQAGSSGVTLAKFKFEATTAEDLDIKGIALELGNVASNSPSDLVGQKVTLWHDRVQIGEAQFGLGTNTDYATSTLSTPIHVQRGESETVVIKGDLSSHTADSHTGAFGALLTVNYDGNNNGLNGNYATGVDSGATISGGTTSDVTTNGVRIYRTVPTIEDVTDSDSLSAGSDLYKIKVTAGSGRDVTLRAMTFDVLATGISNTDGWQLYGPNGAVNATGVATSTSGNAGVGGEGASSGADGRRLRINFDAGATDRIIPAGTSKVYTLRASTISGLTSSNTETIAINLLGDTAHVDGVHSANLHLAQVVEIENGASTTDRFIWSPNSTTTSSAAASEETNEDWANSYGLPGFPGVGQNMPIRVFSH
jgi:hypothetical protein